MITPTQSDKLIVKFQQYYQYVGAQTLATHNVETSWQDIVTTIREWDLTDGDQEEFIARWRNSRQPFNQHVYGDIQRAFSVAGIIKKDEQGPRGNLYHRALRNDKAVGKRRVDRALKVDKLLAQEKPKSAIAELRERAYNEAFSFLGKLAKDYWDLITMETIQEWFDEYKVTWHQAYDQIIETKKAKVRARELTRERQARRKKEAEGE
jgi:hypothetical protein